MEMTVSDTANGHFKNGIIQNDSEKYLESKNLSISSPKGAKS